MCGRFVSASPPDEVARFFDADLSEAVVEEPSWNVAPTDDANVVVEVGDRRVVAAFHWGLVPFWAKDPSVGGRMINARADGLADSNAYRHAFERRRCLVPADGFYEWQVVEDQKRKQPWFIHGPAGELFAIAGLWERWRDPNAPGPSTGSADGTGAEGGWLRSFTIITTDANPRLEAVHDRMPVLLPRSAWGRWLDPDEHDVAALAELLVAAPVDAVDLHPVGPEVGNVRNRGPELVEPVEAGPPPSLFDDPA